MESDYDYFALVFTARRRYASAVLGVEILSVCLSVARVLCDKTKQYTADILIPHERAITLVSHIGWWTTPLLSEICTQSDPPPFEERRLRQISTYNISTVRDSKKVQL